MLPPLHRKAAGDAGFDLELAVEQGWQRLGIGGLRSVVWVRPEGEGALLALPLKSQLAELEAPVAEVADELPAGAGGAVRCASPSRLLTALKRANVLLRQMPPRLEEAFGRELAKQGATEREAIVRQRVGQDVFRKALLDYWEGRCAVTGLAVEELLRASHAKPWRDASDKERLDVHNGVLLAVHLDALFDRGYLTFEDDGRGVVSGLLDGDVRERLGVAGEIRLTRVVPGHLPYLAWHRGEVFRKG